MGAGCNYTHKETGTKAFWIDIERNEDEVIDQFEHEFLMENLSNIFVIDLNYDHITDYKYSNGLFTVELESTYYGDGLVVRLEPHTEDSPQVYNLAMANHNRSYDRIKRTLLKSGYKLSIATSGWTSAQLTD